MSWYPKAEWCAPETLPRSVTMLRNRTLTTNQTIFQESMKRCTMTICNGPAGTGKTYLSCKWAASQFQKGKINKIIITRPAVSIGDSLGYLPGSADDKMDPFVAPMLDVFNDTFGAGYVRRLRYDGKIEIVPLPFTQGRTFKNAIIIADEMQNSSVDQMFMLVTRLGERSKMVILGDLKQKQSGSTSINGLSDLIDKVEKKYVDPKKRKKAGIGMVNLQRIDVRRHPLVSRMTQLYKRCNE